MQDTIFSPSWYRVAHLKPRIKVHAQIHRHQYRGELWYVLQDHLTGKVFRFTPIAYRVIGMMNGRHSVQKLWEKVSQEYSDDAPTQVEMVQLLSRLYEADVLLCDVEPDTRELLLRSRKSEKSSRKVKFSNPFYFRLPLLDPDLFLERTVRYVKYVYTLPGLLLCVFIIGTALVQAGINWDELTRNLADRVFAKDNLIILLIIYPFVKGLHELSHGYAVKRWGGEVHEMGIMFLVFMPIPYVDASSSAVFPRRRQRLTVGAAGIAVEMLLASFAMFIWLSMEPGLLRAAAYNIILIGGVSTLLFNGNPLLRYDGYYILADLLNIPNLAQRSMQYLGYLINRYVFGNSRIETPNMAPGERFWLFFYGITSFCYRIFIYGAIILFVAGKFYIFGVLLALWGGFSFIILPLYKKIQTLLSAPVHQANRNRIILVIVSVITCLLLLLFLLPFPYHSRTEGVVWVPEDAQVRSNTAGIVAEIHAQANGNVAKNEVLIECRDPFLSTQIKIFQSRLKEYELRYNAAYATDKVQASILQEEIIGIRERLSRAEERLAEMLITSPAEGMFVLPQAADLKGRFIEQGELLGYVLKQDATIIRVVVPQRNIDLIRGKTEGVELRFSVKPHVVYTAKVEREIPGAVDHLPSTALGVAGGGSIAVDPLDRSGSKTFERYFQFDLAMGEPLEKFYIGSRVYVRFDHGYEPLAFQWYRSVRQLFLKRFNV